MINRGTYQVEIDSSAWLLEDGIEICTFIGEGACEPVLSYVAGYAELIDQTLESYTLSDNKIPPAHHEEVWDFIAALRSALSYAEHRATEMMSDGQ